MSRIKLLLDVVNDMRSHADSVEAVAETAKEAGYKDIYKQSLIPLTEMEKLMGEKEFSEILGEDIYKPPGKPTLVPITDKRPAINDVNSEFQKMED